jgi:hypothetical protein
MPNSMKKSGNLTSSRLNCHFFSGLCYSLLIENENDESPLERLFVKIFVSFYYKLLRLAGKLIFGSNPPVIYAVYSINR